MLKLVLKEKFLDKEKTELLIKIRNKNVAALMPVKEFKDAVDFDFNRYKIPKNEYEVFIDE